ncbi:hypothetical protein [Streptomyces hesseae]|uniref:hypothetical protein n=1 Tax=Streptomyces hesseae TaxID=3075519 RepID=UPI0034D983E1
MLVEHGQPQHPEAPADGEADITPRGERIGVPEQFGRGQGPELGETVEAVLDQ